jgi:hypothetical protein
MATPKPLIGGKGPEAPKPIPNRIRDSAGINDRGGKNVNPINKAVNTVTSYVGNVAKSYSKWDNLKNAPAHNPEAGQFWGAVLQNRRYDSNGKQVK